MGEICTEQFRLEVTKVLYVGHVSEVVRDSTRGMNNLLLAIKRSKVVGLLISSR